MAPVSLPGAATLFPLPGQQLLFPTAWAPPVGAAPQAPDNISTLMAMGAGSEGAPGPARLPPTHTGLHRAPCGCCCFNPHFGSIDWTVTNVPVPAKATLGHDAAAPSGAALWGPGGCRTLPAWAAPGTPQGQPTPPQLMQLPAYGHQGTAVPAAPPLLFNSIPGHQHLEATSVGAPPASRVPTGTDFPPSPAAAPHNEAPGDLDANIEVTEDTLLQEPLWLFCSSLDTVEVSQDPDTTITTPGDPGGTVREGRAVAPAPTALPTSIPALENTKEWSSETNSSSRASPAQTPLGSDISSSTISSPKSNISPRSDISSESDISPELTFSLKNITYSEQDISDYDTISLKSDTSSSSDNSWESDVPHSQALGDAAGHHAVPHEVSLKEALSLLDCDPSGTGEAAPLCDIDSLSLPEELLMLDYSMEELLEGARILEGFLYGTEGDVPSSSSAVPNSQALGDTAGYLESDVPRSPSAVPNSQALGDTAGHLAVPQEVPVNYFGVEVTRKAVVVLEDIFSRTKSQESCGDTGRELPPAQPTMAEKRGTKQGMKRGTKRGTNSPLVPPRKRRQLNLF
ncbi:uncharacterized protein LOC128900807 [Rissa tridactyla]|uniref:uncharacterized protein LOC128900807 n=1 Tax=Rissa tridactyla TaxID=75485 RepID=UPI0023BA70EA|nr:uncharacterized protein LOC128900807 [Rissa tridactyla]